MEPCAIVGLGNPGHEYEGSRHNVGFRVVDRLCEKTRSAMRPGRGDYYAARVSAGPADLTLVKPMTYMNNSGLAVEDVIRRMGITLDRLMVVVDDVALPLGTIRIRPRGSDGGHNGLYSIIYQLNSDEFPRLRCGIAGEHVPSAKAMADFVLSPFDGTEQESVSAMIDRAAEACLCFWTDGLSAAMNGFNKR